MRDLVIVLTGRVFQVLTALVTLRLLTWRLDQVEMGRYSLLITLFALFALVFINPVGSYINRQLHSWVTQGRAIRFLAYGLFYLVAVCVFSSLILWVAGGSLTALLGMEVSWLIIVIGLYLFANTLNQTIIPSLNLLGKRLEWMLISLASLWIGLTASILLSAMQASAEYWMFGQIVGFSLGALLAFGFLQRALNSGHETTMTPSDSDWKQLRPVMFFALPLAVAVLLNWFQFQSFRFFFGEMQSLARLGVFAAGYAISAGILGAFETTATQYFLPNFYRKLESADRQGQIEAWRAYAALVLPMTFMFVVFIASVAEPLLRLLVDQKYWGAAHFVIIAAVLEASRVIGNAYALAAHALKETRVLLIPQATGAICVLALVPGLLALYGETGFLVALVIASAAYLMVMRQTISRLTGVGLRVEIVPELLAAVSLLALIRVGSSWIELDYLASTLLVAAGLAVCGLTLWRARERIILPQG